jgi:hypothetical protein
VTNREAGIPGLPLNMTKIKKKKPIFDYYWVTVHETQGEFEHGGHFVVHVKLGVNPRRRITAVLKDWRGNASDAEMDGVDVVQLCGGECTVTLDGYKKIPKSHFDFLVKYGYAYDL